MNKNFDKVKIDAINNFYGGNQMKTYDVPDYGYGLGQKCPKDDKMSDFGWGGAAGSYYAIDRKNDITVFLATHILALQTYQRTREQILPIIQEILK